VSNALNASVDVSSAMPPNPPTLAGVEFSPVCGLVVTATVFTPAALPSAKLPELEIL